MLDMEDEIAMAPQPQPMWLKGLAKVPILATVSRSDIFRDTASLPRVPKFGFKAWGGCASPVAHRLKFALAGDDLEVAVSWVVSQYCAIGGRENYSCSVEDTRGGNKDSFDVSDV
jgi:hypothetical protein